MTSTRSFAEDTVETSTTTGTGAYTLAGPKGDYFPFEASFNAGDEPVYVVRNNDNTKIEFNRGGVFTEGSPSTLTRGVWKSTNSDAPVNWTTDDHPLTIYIPGSAELHEQVVIGWLAAARHALLRRGASWFDSTAGLAVSWTHNLYNGVADVWRGRYDAAKGIYIGSNNAPIRDTTTSGSSISSLDRGYIVSHDTSAAVRVAALPAASAVGEGFYVGIYADGIFPVFLDTASSEAVDCAIVPAGTVVWLRCTGTKWLTQGKSSLALIGRRQTVTAGPLSSGAPNLLATVSGLALSTSNVAAATPLIVRASNGDFERWGLSTGNVSFGTLTNTTTNYLYVTVGVDGVLTGGFTTLAPIYQESGTPAVTSGQFTFNYGEMKGYMGNGATAPAVYAVFIGEAVTSGGNVTSVVSYAYNGRYDSGYTATLPAAWTQTSKNHNLGCVPMLADFRACNTTTEAGYAVGDEIGMGSFSQNDGINPYATPSLLAGRKAMSVKTGSTGWIAVAMNASTVTTFTAANWKWRMTADRGW